jgi:hypothetical protein
MVIIINETKRKGLRNAIQKKVKLKDKVSDNAQFKNLNKEPPLFRHQHRLTKMFDQLSPIASHPKSYSLKEQCCNHHSHNLLQRTPVLEVEKVVVVVVVAEGRPMDYLLGIEVVFVGVVVGGQKYSSRRVGIGEAVEMVAVVGVGIDRSVVVEVGVVVGVGIEFVVVVVVVVVVEEEVVEGCSTLGMCWMSMY